MNYALVTVINGNFKVQSEHGEDKKAAFVAFHNKSAALWNAPDTETAVVMVVDSNLDVVEGKKETIVKVFPIEEGGGIRKEYINASRTDL